MLGIGYVRRSGGNAVVFNLGHSHQIDCVPEGIEIDVDAKAAAWWFVD